MFRAAVASHGTPCSGGRGAYRDLERHRRAMVYRTRGGRQHGTSSPWLNLGPPRSLDRRPQ
uniref:Uncharacterized protein n=1 Tax=Arundo donax TaxID=35708 RepID=A0A0A9ANQ5_ARUDO